MYLFVLSIRYQIPKSGIILTTKREIRKNNVAFNRILTVRGGFWQHAQISAVYDESIYKCIAEPS